MLEVKRFTFGPLQENTYVLSTEKDACCLVDPGCYFPPEEETLLEYIESRNLKPGLLLNTHCHLDHVFGDKLIGETFGLHPHFHALDQRVFDAAPGFAEQWGFPYVNYSGPVIYLEEGDVVTLGDDRLEVLFVPGHSPGSIAYYNRGQGFVVAGDVLFRGAIGRTDFPGGSMDVLLHSIRTRLLTLPDETVVYPGHGEETTVGAERARNPFLQLAH